MATPKVLVLRCAGINCNEETAHAWNMVGAEAEQVHLNRLLESPKILDGYAAVSIPGGFSYGDDIASGKVLATELTTALSDALHRFVDRGGMVWGICNGFQVLVKTGLLPGKLKTGRTVAATLTWNDSHRSEDRWVHVQLDGRLCSVVEKHGAIIELPVAHGEGKFITADPADLAALEAAGQVVLRYVSANGGQTSYPGNPNGSVGGAAGVCDATGRVFGLMPHPERFLTPFQHPCWTREKHRTEGDGLSLFRGAMRTLRSS